MSIGDRQPTERFTVRVENYVRFRPGYPSGIIPLLRQESGLSGDWVIADIGSGPGNLTRLFLDAGFEVIGVEPNDAMREAGEVLLGEYPRFESVKGQAEATTLPDGSVDLITAGQAFHWFDPVPTRNEFQRILRDAGWVALIWNKRPEGRSAFLDAWSAMLQAYSRDYDEVRVRDDSAEAGMGILFGHSDFKRFAIQNDQELDAETLWGRLSSSSYTPLPGEAGYDEIKLRCQELFEEFAVDGTVTFPYETQIYLGQLLG